MRVAALGAAGEAERLWLMIGSQRGCVLFEMGLGGVVLGCVCIGNALSLRGQT
jgi:hypothetical protein